MCVFSLLFFLTYTYLSPSQQSHHYRQPYVNEIAMAETEEGYSNIQNGTSSKNSNVIDLLTVFTKRSISDTWSGLDSISRKWKNFLYLNKSILQFFQTKGKILHWFQCPKGAYYFSAPKWKLRQVFRKYDLD